MSVDTHATVAASAQAYAQLAELELEFDQAEAELLKHQIALFEPIYTRRQAVLASIPSFWSIIFENFGPELDEHITTEDWAFLGENLTSVNVSRPDVASNNPRTFEITFGLKDGNGVIDATEIRKKFIYRSLRDGDESWAGLISEPVEVKWISDEKDLSGGINGLSKRIFDVRKKRVEGRIEEMKNEGKRKGKKGQGKEDVGLSELELELEEKLNQTQSFFNWFSWTGDYFMVMEKEAEMKLREEKKAKGEEVIDSDEDDEKQGETDGIDVFPDGEKLAYLIAEDMFPSALKHFADAMEHNEPAEGDTDEEDGNDTDAESIELDSDLEAQLMKGNMRFQKQAGKKKRKSDDEMEEVDEEESTRGKKKARK
ncbi:hypothetical protein L211DRAFT_834690 [Terfezia boudieri ATCC MYA-4762]|uniref:Nap family protein n=1 Tax=Terfezia boudieri ATCC MYA-4762 TaxID=1051890 RepID=A0A3N4LZL5_9PEZI|nr:hypothetical protein L211DRAFT_834690 [Terfezia boudieri ATCC MYA-4762]